MPFAFPSESVFAFGGILTNAAHIEKSPEMRGLYRFPLRAHFDKIVRRRFLTARRVVKDA
jgi:hypothetical protein